MWIPVKPASLLAGSTDGIGCSSTHTVEGRGNNDWDPQAEEILIQMEF